MDKIKSCYTWFQNKLKDQDFMQRTNVITTVSLEMYRLMVSSFLILFVPQKCGDHVCSLSENMIGDDPLYKSGLVLNFVTMGSMLTMYGFEMYRENKLIEYMDVNPQKPNSNDDVKDAMVSMTDKRRSLILSLDKNYQRSAYNSMVFFCANTVLSGFVVYKYYLDNQTTMTFITNILFMISKLGDVYTTVSTEDYVFYSAYLKGKIQYNDADQDKTPSPIKQEIEIIPMTPETSTESVSVEIKEEVV